MASEARGDAVVRLVGPGLPADRGLASLALLMQLGGGLAMVGFGALAVIPVAAGWPGSFTWFLLGVLAAGRAAVHRYAGADLLYGAGDRPLTAVFAYLVTAAVQTALTALLLRRAGVGGGDLVAVVGALLVWPAALLAVFHPRSPTSPARGGLIYSEDFGFEGTAVLMAILGALGVGVAGAGLGFLLERPGTTLTSPAGFVVVGIFATLLVRSGLHARAGFHGAAGADFDSANRSASRYYNFAIASSVVIGIATFVLLFLRASFGAALLAALTLAALLLVWPVTLRRFYGERGFTLSMAGSAAPTFRRAPDAGLTALGWFLLAVGLLSLAGALPAALGAHRLDLDLLHPHPTGALGAAVAGHLRSDWWTVGVAGLQLWTAVELIRMTGRHRLAARIYGAVGLLVALYLTWPLVGAVDRALDQTATGLAAPLAARMMIFGQAAFALVAALATIVLVERATPDDAVARAPGPEKPKED